MQVGVEKNGKRRRPIMWEKKAASGMVVTVENWGLGFGSPLFGNGTDVDIEVVVERPCCNLERHSQSFREL